MITQVLTVRVQSGQGPRVRLWIPLLPIYLILLPLLLLAALLLVVACVVYRVNPARALVSAGRLLTGLRGLNVEVNDSDTTVLVKVS
jgi:hypothetical protein